MNMCERLIHMIGGLATPVDVKLQLIEVFQHMHHDAETAATVSDADVFSKLILYFCRPCQNTQCTYSIIISSVPRNHFLI